MKEEFRQADLFDTSDLLVEPFPSKSPINTEKLTGQNKVLYEYLEKGNTITQWKAIKKFGITRLGARIYELRYIAHIPIHDRFISEAGSKVKEYSLRPFEDETTKTR